MTVTSIRLYAQPYNIDATGFYFTTEEEYRTKASKNLTRFGEPVEEYEIQFIDGEDIDAELFKAIGINQANFSYFLEEIDSWDEDDKIRIIIAVGEGGYSFNLSKDSPEDFDIDIYEMDNLRELAHYFVDEGLYGDIPKNLQSYIDYDAIARDLGFDYTETIIAGKDLIYRLD